MYEKIGLIAVSAFIGWTLSWQRFQTSENANIINDHIKDIERFSDVLRKHWLKSYTDVDVIDQKREIAEIKSMYISISTFYGEAEKRLGHSRYRSYQMSQVRLFNVGMGGDFESIGRGFSEVTAIESQQLSWELIHSLRIARREQYSLIKNTFTKICYKLSMKTN